MLRNMIGLKPIVDNVTCWSGKLHVIRRFNRIYGDLIEVAETDEVELPIGKSMRFKNMARRYERMSDEINALAVIMERKGISSNECRMYLTH